MLSLDPSKDSDKKEIAAVLDSAIHCDAELLAKPVSVLSESLKLESIKDSLNTLPVLLSDSEASEVLHKLMKELPGM